MSYHILSISSRNYYPVPYSLVVSFNVGPGFYLCNVREVCAILAGICSNRLLSKINRPKLKTAV